MTDDPESAPSATVHRQVAAYNEGDIDAFTACYAEEAVITSLDENAVVAEGREEIYDQYSELFEEVPDLHCEVVEEFTVRDYVVIKERVTGIADSEEFLAVYRVSDGVIEQLWLGGEE